MADIMGDYGQLKAKAKADAGYESFQGHGGLKPPPGMTPEQEARWRRAVEGQVEELSAAKSVEDAARSKQRAKVAGQVAAETAVGFTPAGIAIDVKDLVSAISDRDALMLAMSMLAFVPGADVIKSAAKARRRLEAVPKRKLAEVIEQNPERLSQETRSVVFEGAPKPKKTEPLTDVDIAEATKAAADIRAGRRVSPERTRKAEALETEEGTRLLQEDEAFREAMARESAPSTTQTQRRIAEERGDPEMLRGPELPYEEYVPPAPAKIRAEPVTSEEMARQSALLRETLGEGAPVATRPFRPRPLTSEPRTLREREVLPEPVSQAVPDLAEPLPTALSGPRRTSLVDDPVGGLVESSSTGRSQVKTFDELSEEAAARRALRERVEARRTETTTSPAETTTLTRPRPSERTRRPLPTVRAKPEPLSRTDPRYGPGIDRTPKKTPEVEVEEPPGLLQTPLSDIKIEQLRRAFGGKPRPEGLRVQRRTPEGTSTWEQDGTLYIRDTGERTTGLRTSDPGGEAAWEAKRDQWLEMAESLDQPNIVPGGRTLADPRARGTITPEGFVPDPLSLGERASGAARAAGERIQELSPEQRRRVAAGLAGTGFAGVGTTGAVMTLRSMRDADEEEPPQEAPAVETQAAPEPIEQPKLEPAPPLPPPAEEPKKETKKAAPKKKDAASTTKKKGPPPKPTDWNK
jgi:hypothetical protein